MLDNDYTSEALLPMIEAEKVLHLVLLARGVWDAVFNLGSDLTPEERSAALGSLLAVLADAAAAINLTYLVQTTKEAA